MKIDRISYQKIFPTGVYMNEKIGFEASLDEGELPYEAIEKLKKLTEVSHKIINPKLYPNGDEAIVEGFSTYPVGEILTWPPKQEPLTNEERKNQTIQSHIKTINECKTLRNLEMFKGTVERENDPELLEAYDKKEKELS